MAVNEEIYVGDLDVEQPEIEIGDIEATNEIPTGNHNDLYNRDADNQHPISAITGLQEALDSKVDEVEGKGLSENDFTDEYKAKLDGIEDGAEVNTITSVNGKTGDVVLATDDISDANQDNKFVSTQEKNTWNNKVDKDVNNLTNYTKTSDLGTLAMKDSVDYSSEVYNKPAINNGTLTIQKNGTTIGTFGANSSQDVTVNIEADQQVQSDWNQSNSSKPDYIKNKPTIPVVNNGTLTIQKNGVTVATFTANSSNNVTANIEADAQVQSDWSEANSSEPDYIKNKPDLSGFITNTVDNLVYYYLKSETYTQAEVNALIAAIKTIEVQIVAQLPTASADTYFNTSKTIYMVANSSQSGNNYYDEYITIRSGSEGAYTYSWENIGSTQIDLTNYVQKTTTIAGVDLQDNITKSELANALGISPDLNIVNGDGDGSVKLKGNISRGNKSSALGHNNTVQADRAFASGGGNIIRYDGQTQNGYMGFASGQNNYVSGWSASAIGEQLEAKYGGQFIIGVANKNKSNTLFEVGNGTTGFVNVDTKPTWQEIIDNPIYYTAFENGYRKITQNTITLDEYNLLTASDIYVFDDTKRSNAFEVTQLSTIINNHNSVAEDVEHSLVIGGDNTVGELNNEGSGWNSLVAGVENTAYGNRSYIFGYNNVINTGNIDAYVEGERNGLTSSGETIETQSLGNLTSTGSSVSHVEGSNNINGGPNSHIEGVSNTNVGNTAHIEGSGNINTMNFNHTEGFQNKNLSVAGHAEGMNNTLGGIASHVEGSNNMVTTNYAHASGIGNITSRDNQVVIGQYSDILNTALFEVGNGSADNARSNAFEVLENGVVRAYGTPSGNNDLTPKSYVDGKTPIQSISVDSHTLTPDGNKNVAIPLVGASMQGSAGVVKTSESYGTLSGAGYNGIIVGSIRTYEQYKSGSNNLILSKGTLENALTGKGLKTLTGSGAPTTSTVGVIGQIYKDTTTNNIYICNTITEDTSTTPSTFTYTWIQLIRATDVAGQYQYGVIMLGDSASGFNHNQYVGLMLREPSLSSIKKPRGGPANQQTVLLQDIPTAVKYALCGDDRIGYYDGVKNTDSETNSRSVSMTAEEQAKAQSVLGLNFGITRLG